MASRSVECYLDPNDSQGCIIGGRLPQLKGVELISPTDARLVVDRQKVVDYLLSDSHPVGRFKNRFFVSFGFHAAEWTILQHALIEQAMTNDVTMEEQTEYGIKYVVDGPLPSPDGRSPAVRTIWIRRNDETDIHLVTAYPLREFFG